MAKEPITIDEKKHVTWVTLRAHPDRTLDEVLASGVMKIHLEQMDDGLWWLGIEKDGERQVVWFESDTPIHAWTAEG